MDEGEEGGDLGTLENETGELFILPKGATGSNFLTNDMGFWRLLIGGSVRCVGVSLVTVVLMMAAEFFVFAAEREVRFCANAMPLWSI